MDLALLLAGLGVAVSRRAAATVSRAPFKTSVASCIAVFIACSSLLSIACGAGIVCRRAAFVLQSGMPNAHWPLPWPKAESNTAQDLTKARPAPSSPCLLPAVGDARAAARSCLLQSGASGSTAHMHTYAHNVGSESQNRFERQCHARVWAKGAMDELLSLSFHDLRSRSQESIMRSLPCASCFGVRGCCSFFGFLLGFGALVWSPRLAPEKMSEPRSSRASSEP